MIKRAGGNLGPFAFISRVSDAYGAFARLREHGVTFGVVVAKDHVIDQSGANDAVSYWSRWLECPTILLSARRHKLYGRKDIVQFMSRVSLSSIPWREAAV